MSSRNIKISANLPCATDAVTAFPVAPPLSLTDKMGRLWELIGIWLVSLILGVLVVQMLVISENNEIRERWKHQRYEDTLRYLNASLERDLSLGLDPIANGAGQRAFDDALGRDESLYEVQMIGHDGRILIDSDRTSVGTLAPKSVIDAMTQSLDRALNPEAQADQEARQERGKNALMDVNQDVNQNDRGTGVWRVTYAGQAMQGRAVRNAFGQTVAYTVVSYASTSDEPVIMTVLAELFIYLGIAVLTSGVAAWLALECAGMRRASRAMGEIERQHAAGMIVAKRRLRQLERRLSDVRQAGQDQTS